VSIDHHNIGLLRYFTEWSHNQNTALLKILMKINE